MRGVLLVLLSLALGISGLLLWRQALAGVGGITLGSTGLGGQLLDLLSAWTFWAGSILLSGVAVVSLELYSTAELSSVLPLYSLGYVIVALLDRFAFGQAVPLERWFGIGLILAGVVLVVRSA